MDDLLGLPTLSGPAGMVAFALVIVGWLLRLGALVVVPRHRRPSSALAWLLAVFFLPIPGAIAFLLIGNPKLPQHRRDKQAHMNELISGAAADAGELVVHRPSAAWLEPVVTLDERLGAMPMVNGNDLDLVTDYGEQLAELAAGIRAARETVHLEFYILSLDDTTRPLFDALADARARGVTVRVLFDHMGSRPYPGYRATVRFLDRARVDWHLMLPVQPLRGRWQRPDLRNHRKLLVVDSDVAWVGSMNIIDRGYQKPKNRRRGLQWQDLLVRARGPVVHEVDALFVTDWFSETGELPGTVPDEISEPGPGHLSQCQVVPSGPGFADENNLKMFLGLVYGARRRLSIASPYFVPDESLLDAVTAAAQRGVEVELFVGAIGDQAVVFHAQRSYYEALLDAGVRIWLYPAPYVLHAKHVTVDDDVAVVGSSNMDIRSFLLDLELMLLVSGREFTDRVREVEDDYRSRSRELTLKEWLGRPRRQQLLDNLARLTSALQ